MELKGQVILDKESMDELKGQIRQEIIDEIKEEGNYSSEYELYDRRNKTKEKMNNDNDQEIELKPCPFCGGKANMIKNECEENGFTGWFVFHDCRSLQDIRTKIKDTREEAADCWNKRYDKHETD